MVQEKYIKRGNKLHGPYYYETYRDEDGNTKKRYLGKTLKDQEGSSGSKMFAKKIYLPVIIGLLAIFLILAVRFELVGFSVFTGAGVNASINVSNYSLGEEPTNITGSKPAPITGNSILGDLLGNVGRILGISDDDDSDSDDSSGSSGGSGGSGGGGGGGASSDSSSGGGSGLSGGVDGGDSGSGSGDPVVQLAPGDWEPPIGIPAPSFGIDEQHSDPEFCGSEGCFDRTAGSISGTINAGEVVQVSGTVGGGTLTANCNAANPCILRGPNVNNKAVVNTWLDIRGSYLILENIEVNGGVTMTNTGPDHIVLRNMDIGDRPPCGSNQCGGVVQITSWDGSPIDNIVIFNTTIHDNGQWGPPFTHDEDMHAVNLGAGVSYVWVLDSELYRSSGDGIQMEAGGSNNLHHVYVGRNLMYQNGQAGVGIKVARDVVISENVMHSFVSNPGGGTPGDGFYSIFTQANPQNIWVMYNEIYDTPYGIRFAAGSGLYAIGNVVYDTSTAALHVRGSGGVHLVGNTVYDSPLGIQLWASTDEISNNILWNAPVDIEGNSPGTSVDNLCTSVSPFVCDITSNPQFVNPSINPLTRDFHLESTSPARNAGSFSSVYNYDSTFGSGLSIQKDFDGNDRPVDQWDVGAFEYGSGDCVASGCQDGDQCVSYVCNTGTGQCDPVYNASTTLCNDNNACTNSDMCDGAGSCSGTMISCDNGLYCDGVETCDIVSGCQAGSAVNCNDGYSCTTDSCNEGTDSCDNVDSGSCVLPDVCSPSTPGANPTTGCVFVASCGGETQCSEYGSQGACEQDPCTISNCFWQGGACVAGDPNLVLHWAFDDTISDGVAEDSTNNNLDGSCSGGACPTYFSNGGSSGVGGDSAYDFNGADDLSRGSSGALSGFDEITLSVWVDVNNWPSDGYRFIVGKSNWADSREYRIRANGAEGELAWMVAGGSSEQGYLTVPFSGVSTNEWHMLTGTWDGSTMRFYIDGSEVGTPVSYSRSSLWSGSADFAVGTSGNNGGGNDDDFTGTIDDVRLYDRALSSGEINALYVAGSGGAAETCSDGIQNQDEVCADIGGVCGSHESGTELSCSDGKDNDCDGDVDAADSDCFVALAACGDGNTDPGEQCDDGDTDPGDGCSDICVIEDGEVIFSSAGDFDYEWNGVNEVLDTIVSNDSDFFIALGDLSYGQACPSAGTCPPDTEEELWCTFVTSRVGANFPFQLLSGDHEDGGTGTDGHIDNFASCLPDRMTNTVGDYAKEYYFDYPSLNPLIRFIMISPDLNFVPGAGLYDYSQGGARYTWTENAINDAQTNNIPWIIVGMHRNCISVGEKSCDIGEDIFNLLLSEKVDLILQANDHGYQRSKQFELSAGCPGILVDGYDSDCVVDDGADNHYVKGAGSVLVISAAGSQTFDNINLADSEIGYFATWMGGNVNPTSGLALFNVTQNRLAMEFAGAFGGTYTDSFTITSALPAACGDGTVDAGEVCDDGGTIPGDGCDASCQVEATWECDGASPTICNQCDLTSAVWNPTGPVGDGISESLVISGDHCSNDLIDYTIYEAEAGSDDVVVSYSDVPYSTIQMWTTQWIDDGFLQGDPEYYFVATAQGSGDSETSPDLTVTNAACNNDGTCNFPSEDHLSCPNDCDTYCGDSIQQEMNSEGVLEVCDPPGSIGSCTTTEGYDGTRSCAADCASFGTCTTTESCGDGVKNGPEACDGSDFGSETCDTQGFYGGSLSCNSCVIDTSNCGTLDPASRTADVPDSWLVLYNSNSADSIAWKDWYIAQWGIPAENTLGLDVSTSEKILEAEYISDIYSPVVSAVNNPVISSKIMGILVGYDVPGNFYRDGTQPTLQGGGGWSVSNNLMDLSTASPGTINNPAYFLAYASPAKPRYTKATLPTDYYFTARIDGPDLASVQALTTRARTISTNPNPLDGAEVIHYDYSDVGAPGGDSWLILENTINDVLFSDPDVYPWMEFNSDSEAVPNSAFQFSYYQLTGWQNENWGGVPPGSRILGYAMNSWGATTVRSTTAHGGRYVANALYTGGYAAAVGATAEPFLSTIPDPGAMLYSLQDGRTLAEAFAHSSSRMNWMFEVVGDPLLEVPIWWQDVTCGDGDGICPVGCTFFGDSDVDCPVGECVGNFDCSDDYSCTTNSCNTGSGSGVCEFDNSACGCLAADLGDDAGGTTPDGDVDLFDLIKIGNYYATNDIRGNVDGQGGIDIFDLIYVASRFDVCASY